MSRLWTWDLTKVTITNGSVFLKSEEGRVLIGGELSMDMLTSLSEVGLSQNMCIKIIMVYALNIYDLNLSIAFLLIACIVF